MKNCQSGLRVVYPMIIMGFTLALLCAGCSALRSMPSTSPEEMGLEAKQQAEMEAQGQRARSGQEAVDEPQP